MAKQQSTENLSRIPICASDFLQDVSIELGRRMKSVRYHRRNGRFEFRVTTTEFKGEDLECFEVICWIGSASYIQVVVLENGVANYMFREEFQHKYDDARYTGFIVTLKDWQACDVANLISDSLVGGNGVQETWRKLHDENKRRVN